MVKELIDSYKKTHLFTHQATRFIEEPQLLNELVDVSISDLPHPYPEYASWLLVHVSDKEPRLLESFQPSLIERILNSKNQSVLRNLTNVICSLPLIEYKESELLDKLLEFIKDDTNKPALFVYSLYKLIQFTHNYPEIKNEVDGIIALKQEPIKPSQRIGIRNYQKATDPKK